MSRSCFSLHYFLSITLLWSSSLLLALPKGTAARKEGKTCVKDSLTRGKELKQYVLESHVLVAVQENGGNKGDDDDDSDFQELCDRLQSTPLDRVKDFDIVTVQASSFRKKVLAKAVTPETSDIWGKLKNRLADLVRTVGGNDPSPATRDDNSDPEYPEYVLFSKGNFETAIRYPGADKSADAISTFVSEQLKRKKIGNFLYSLGIFDMLASKFVGSIRSSSSLSMGGNNNDDDSRVNWKARAWAYTAKIVYIFQAYHPDKWIQGDYAETGSLAGLYVKTMFSILEKGLDYPKRQIQRLERMLESSSENLSDTKIEELQQRIYTLKKFTEPIEVTDDQASAFVKYAAANVGFTIAMVVLLPMLLFASDDEVDNPTEIRETEEATEPMDSNGKNDENEEKHE